ncbi:MAG TPA: HepT-like ribonuclease domain-containing protein [Thermomicrobiales bacterium]|nr:HepT-like ribonuclease domain-containing protein [Thermomicrobiales bacterium]
MRIPELRDIVNTRNRITHGYNAVNFNLLWDIVPDDIAPLRDSMAALLREAPPPGKNLEA